MTITPAIKGQLTKAVKAHNPGNTFNIDQAVYQIRARFNVVRDIFAKHLPREQAKHAARKYLASIA